MDSAPSVYKEAFDYGDVNLTLGGYLHTIHSPAVRQQLTMRLQNNKFNNAGSFKNQLSLGNNNNNQRVNGDGVALSTMFNPSVNKNTQKDEIPLLSNNSPDALNISGKKTGRFTSVPAKIEMKNITPKSDKEISCNFCTLNNLFIFLN